MKHAILPLLLTLVFVLLAIQAYAGEESPIHLSKSEGSKSFDMEISIKNEKGIRLFDAGDFEGAKEYFSKAEALARQFRDPGLGVVSFNLGLALHKLNLHEDAVEAFATAKKYARGHRSILDSNLIRLHECGFNPSIPCKEQPPAKMHIEGSN